MQKGNKFYSRLYIRIFKIQMVLLLWILCFFSVSCKKKQYPPQTVLVMGTVCTVNLYDAGTAELYKQIIDRLYEIEREFSVSMPDSQISTINKQAGIAPVQVSEDVITVLDTAVLFAKKTNGAFDPTIGPLVKLWNIGTEFAHLPSDKEIQNALSFVDYHKIIIDHIASTVYLEQSGMSLDLGGIVKGYAADEIVRILKQQKVTRALIDLGGNIYAYGCKKDDAPWRVGIRNPFDTQSEPPLGVQVDDQTVVTSGVYERFFIQDGVRYHHIINPKTGYPMQNGLVSVTIISDSSMYADALSTSVFILGISEGLAFLKDFSETEGILIDDTKCIYVTSELQNKITVFSHDFSVKIFE